MCPTGCNMMYFPTPRAFHQSRNQFPMINRMSKCTKATITPANFMFKCKIIKLFRPTASLSQESNPNIVKEYSNYSNDYKNNIIMSISCSVVKPMMNTNNNRNKIEHLKVTETNVSHGAC